MTWKELKTKIEHMTPEQREEKALFLSMVMELEFITQLVTDHGAPYLYSTPT